MQYHAIYNALIERAKARELTGYVERHHIIPRCQNGDDSPDNIVRLTAREHFIAHQLLVKMHPNNFSLIKALFCLCHFKSGKQIRNNKEYAWIKEKHANAQSARLRGKTKETDIGIAKMADTLRGRKKETHISVAKMADALRGRTKETHAGVAAQSEKITGRTKENHSGVATHAEKMRGRTKETHAGVAAQSEKIAGRTKETHQGLRISSEKRSILPSTVKVAAINRKLKGETPKNIHQWILSFGYGIAYSSVAGLLTREIKRMRLACNQ